MQQALSIGSRTYELVRTQRGGVSFVYKGEEGYLRIGVPRIIAKHLNAHNLMEAAGYAVPRILAVGEHEGQLYFIEESMGDTRLGDAFAADCAEKGEISTERFGELLEVVRKYGEAQLRAPKPPGNLRGFKPAIHIRTLSRELPEDAEKIVAQFREITARLSVFPDVLSHGDFNPQNLFARGIIDLEHAFHGPWGYDLVTALVHINQFPDSRDFEYFARYRYSDAQKSQYLATIDTIATKNGLPELSAFLPDFEFCRAVWSSVRMAEHPKLQRWRYDLFQKDFLQ